MRHNDSNANRGIACRFRSVPRSLGFALLAVPVTAAAVGTFGVLPATANQTRPQQVSQRSGSDTDKIVISATTPTTARPKSKDQPTTKGDDRPARALSNQHRYTEQQALAAYFDAGYLYEDAVALKKLWNSRAEVSDVKVRAGRKLLAGSDLPVDPSGTAAPEQEAAERAALDAYFDAGYDSADADLLARLWGHSSDIYKAKLRAGTKLLAGVELPIEHGQTAWNVSQEAALTTYFSNGYDYDDALVLAAIWSGGSDLTDVKANAGHKILDGLPLPGGVLPFDGDQGDQVDQAQQAALDAYFAAGYDYDDAVALAKVWGGVDPFDAKVMAGNKLIAGLELPVVA